MPKDKYTKENASLETLLDLDGEIFPMENGYWTKFEAFKVEPTPQIPHGVKYALTLHDPAVSEFMSQNLVSITLHGM